MSKGLYFTPSSEVVTVQMDTAITSGPEFEGMDPNEEEW